MMLKRFFVLTLFIAFLSVLSLHAEPPDNRAETRGSNTRTSVPVLPEASSEEEIKSQPFEIFAQVDSRMFVGDQSLVLKVAIVYSRQLSPFWEALKELNLSPFKIEKMSLSEAKPFDVDKTMARDFREARFFLFLPPGSSNGEYEIPSFSLEYSYFENRQELTGSALSQRILVEKVPILAHFSVEKDVMLVGETNVLKLTIIRQPEVKVLNHELKLADVLEDEGNADIKRWFKSLKVRGQEITELTKPELGIFKITDVNFWKKNIRSAVVENYEYRFSFYERGGKGFELPAFHVWYLDTVLVGAQDLKFAKEIKTPSLPVYINTSLSETRQSIEWIKDPALGSRFRLYFYGYLPLFLGSTLLVVFLYFVSRARGWSSGDVCKLDLNEPIDCVLKRLEGYLTVDYLDTGNMEFYIVLRKDLAKVLGRVLGLRDDTLSATKSAKDFILLSENADCPSNLKDALIQAIQILDCSISLGQFKKEDDWEKIVGLVREII